MNFEKILDPYYKDEDGKIVSKNIKYIKISEFFILLKQVVSESPNGLFDVSEGYLSDKIKSYFGEACLETMKHPIPEVLKFIEKYKQIWNECSPLMVRIYNSYNTILRNNTHIKDKPEVEYNICLTMLGKEEDISLNEFSYLHELLEQQKLIPKLKSNKVRQFFNKNYSDQNDKNSPPINIIFLSDK